MRIRRSVTRVFEAMVVPAITGAVAAYFGYYAIWGDRGAIALEDAKARLGVRQEGLSQVRERRMRLQHRIQLMRPGQVDPDLVEELYRKDLMEGAPNQVAIPRKAQ
jgi:cell division protein FtsB